MLGWYGMFALITAYALASFDIVPADGVTYQLLNLTGSFGLLVIAAAKGVMQAVLTNVFWMAIGLIAILTILFKNIN